MHFISRTYYLFQGCTLKQHLSYLPPPIPHPLVTTIYSLFLQVWLFYIPHISEIIQYLSFSDLTVRRFWCRMLGASPRVKIQELERPQVQTTGWSIGGSQQKQEVVWCLYNPLFDLHYRSSDNNDCINSWLQSRTNECVERSKTEERAHPDGIWNILCTFKLLIAT